MIVVPPVFMQQKCFFALNLFSVMSCKVGALTFSCIVYYKPPLKGKPMDENINTYCRHVPATHLESNCLVLLLWHVSHLKRYLPVSCNCSCWWSGGHWAEMSSRLTNDAETLSGCWSQPDEWVWWEKHVCQMVNLKLKEKCMYQQSSTTTFKALLAWDVIDNHKAQVVLYNSFKGDTK